MKNAKLNYRIGNYIRSIRSKKGLTEKELANLINVSQQQISRYEKGTATVSIDRMLHILYMLNLSMDDFVENIIIPEQENLHKKMFDELKKEGTIKSLYD
ncbi:helix-turn-helix domain-containing protein [Providencia alcalifaciens]|uniref:helix-turn-helix domain-containing protein n=1 Tax=Providencia alcalifaciens TaxID=126385 RepID=UPI00029C4BDA|nr:fimbrial operon regulator [Providencia alcalifaciens Dmel2]